MAGTSSGLRKPAAGRQQEFPFQPKQRRIRVRGLGVFLRETKTQTARQPEFPATAIDQPAAPARATTAASPIVADSPTSRPRTRTLLRSTAKVYQRPKRPAPAVIGGGEHESTQAIPGGGDKSGFITRAETDQRIPVQGSSSRPTEKPGRPASTITGTLRLLMLLADLLLIFGGVYLVSTSLEPVPLITIGIAIAMVIAGAVFGLWALLRESE